MLIRVNGIIYQSWKVFANKHNLPYANFKREIKKRNLEYKVQWVDNDNCVFTSFNEMCRAHNVDPYFVAKNILQKGMTVAEALSVERVTRKINNGFTFNGRHYNNLGDLCDSYGISRYTFYKRIRKGETWEQALDHKSRKSMPKKFYPYEGKMLSAKEISKQLNISESGFYYHLKKHGADNIDEVIKTIKELNYLYTDLEGRRFKSLKALCFANKINYYTVLNYTRRRGFPLDKAIKRLQNSKRTYLAKSKSL